MIVMMPLMQFAGVFFCVFSHKILHMGNLSFPKLHLNLPVPPLTPGTNI